MFLSDNVAILSFRPHEWTTLKRVDSKRMVIILHTNLGKAIIWFWTKKKPKPKNIPFWSKFFKLFMKGCASKEKLQSRATKPIFDLPKLIWSFKYLFQLVALPMIFMFMMVSLAFWYDMVGLIEDLNCQNNLIHTYTKDHYKII